MPKLSPIVHLAGRRLAVDAPNLSFATAIVAWVVWFCWDAWRASAAVENVILIVPVSIAAVILYLFVAVGCFHRLDDAQDTRPSEREPLPPGIAVKIVGSMALLGAFVVAGPHIGFDIASFAYMLAMMAFGGERRIPALLLVPILFSVTVIYFFSTVLSTPLPLFFGEHAS
jgi:hypothetical protein